MLLIKSKWILDGKQMQGKEVPDFWEEHLKANGIKYEKKKKKSAEIQ